MEAIAVHTKADVIQRLKDAEPRIRAFGVRRLALFGSFVRDEAGPESDVDLLVDLGPEGETLGSYMGLVYFLDDLLGRKVEVVSRDFLSPYIGPHILREAEDVLAAAA